MSNLFIFESEARSMIHRDGLENLLAWLADTDFYTSPASTRFHGSEEGGLVLHSLCVYDWMFRLDKIVPMQDNSFESMAIVSLFHDICKADTYIIDYKNQKNPDTGAWERVPYYKYQDDSGFGSHGAKSAKIVSDFMKLTDEEYIAILHHMGAYDMSTYTSPSKAYEKYPLAWMLHCADELAAFISKT